MDKARKETDKKLKQMEKKLRKIYDTSINEITEKWNTYLDRSNKELDRLWLDYATETDKAKKRQALEKYQVKAKSQTLRNLKYKDMVEEVSYRMAKVNETALAYVNGEMPNIYTINYNQIANEIPMGVTFNIVSEDTVKKLATQGDIKLPNKALNIPKDERWNTKQLNSAVLQGILQGESMRDIAKRILPIVDNNKEATVRNARTMVTGAENGGRLDSYERLEEQGVILKKVWIATPDDRTRTWHLDMDGQEVDIDEPFIDGNGDEIDYPGDTTAEPRTVYNCRCSMKSHILGFKKGNQINYVNVTRSDKSHVKAIEEERAEREHNY